MSGSIRKEYHNYITAYRTWLPLLRHVDSNLSKKMRLADLAQARNCSLSKLQRDFTATFSQSLGDFIIKRRLHHASQLICNSNLTLAEIAEQTGFSDAFALSKSFRKCYGLSPREYRKISVRQ